MTFDMKKYQKEYREKNKDKINKRKRELYEKNKEEEDKRKKAYYEKNKDEICEKRKQKVFNMAQGYEPIFTFKELCGFIMFSMTLGIVVGICIGVDLVRYWGW